MLLFLSSLDCGAINVSIDVCARGVMGIVVGNGHGDMSSNPGRD